MIRFRSLAATGPAVFASPAEHPPGQLVRTRRALFSMADASTVSTAYAAFAMPMDRAPPNFGAPC
jgi:hypothetical protein